MNITDEALPDTHKNESYDVRLIKFMHLQSEQTHSTSKLQSSAFKNCHKALINHQAIRMNIDKAQLDIQWMPAVLQFNRETLEKTCDLLIQIETYFTKKMRTNFRNYL
ncbi:unnamed protein product [Rotaria magnacalcarata]